MKLEGVGSGLKLEGVGSGSAKLEVGRICFFLENPRKSAKNRRFFTYISEFSPAALTSVPAALFSYILSRCAAGGLIL